MSLLTAISKAITSALAFPQLMRIDTVRINQKAGGYNADGELLEPGTLKKTDELLTQVPITIPVATNAGAGLYTISEPGQIAIVQYLEGNKAHPVITGYWTDEYLPPVNNEATISIHTGSGKLRLANANTSMATILNDLLDILMQLTTQGSPTTQVISPATITTLQNIKTKLGTLLEK